MTTHNTLKITISQEYIDDMGLRRWLNVELPANFPETDNPQPFFEETLSKVNKMYAFAEGKTQLSQKENIGNDEDVFAMMDKCLTAEDLMRDYRLYPMNEKEKAYYDNKLKSLLNNH